VDWSGPGMRLLDPLGYQLERDTVTTYRLRLRVGPGPGVTVP